MRLNIQQMLAVLVAMTTAWGFFSPRAVFAEDHVVPLTELHRQAQSAAQERARDLDDIGRALALPEAQGMLQKAAVTPEQVRMAVATLSDQEVARLADRARIAQQDVHGGLIVGLLALIGLVVVIIIVVAVVKS
jgi:hypothetical protein